MCAHRPLTDCPFQCAISSVEELVTLNIMEDLDIPSICFYYYVLTVDTDRGWSAAGCTAGVGSSGAVV